MQSLRKGALAGEAGDSSPMSQLVTLSRTSLPTLVEHRSDVWFGYTDYFTGGRYVLASTPIAANFQVNGN
jgi:hypothetical protein